MTQFLHFVLYCVGSVLRKKLKVMFVLPQISDEMYTKAASLIEVMHYIDTFLKYAVHLYHR